MKCPTCGCILPPRRPGAGRPSTYCSVPCRDAAYALGNLRSWIQSKPVMSRDALTALRGDLFRLANAAGLLPTTP